MTDQEINEAIARACGWKKVENDYCVYWTDKENLQGWKTSYPSYTTDLNAMADAEKTLTDVEKEEYIDHLRTRVDQIYLDEVFEIVTSTARQRATAFLKCKGLWKEDI